MSAKHTPHPVAVADPVQWLRTFALQFKGETRASLEHCAKLVDAVPDMHAALREAREQLVSDMQFFQQPETGTYGQIAKQCDAAIAKAEWRT